MPYTGKSRTLLHVHVGQIARQTIHLAGPGWLHRDFAAHHARQQQVARGAELLVLRVKDLDLSKLRPREVSE